MKRMLWSVVSVLVGTAGAAVGQEGPAGGPTTYALARKANYVLLETLRETRAPIPASLGRRVTIVRDGVLLQQVLLDIANQAELGLSYGEDLVRARVVVSLRAKNETAADALQQVTDGTDWVVLVTPVGQVAVLRREPAQVGAIVGSVTDAKTGTALGGATVVVEGTSLGTTSGNDGHYRIVSVSPGTYTVRARFIGYAPGSASVTVAADQEATADFALERLVQKLDELVTTTPGGLQSEVRTLPTPITVITARDIERQRPQTLNDVIRQAVPTAIAWDFPNTPAQVSFSVRGANSLSGTGPMKVFVDGVEVATLGDASVDPSSVERVEVLRGPQAATLYGADAAGGVVQIFTKRGDPQLKRPQIALSAELGVVETPYAGKGEVLRQNHSGSVRGGAQDLGYHFGGGYTRLADYITTEPSGYSIPSVYGGINFTQGIVAADISARHLVNRNPSILNPQLEETGFLEFSTPQFTDTELTTESYGARFRVTPLTWWRNHLTVGVDQSSFSLVQRQPRLTFPGDTFMIVGRSRLEKLSVGYNTSVTRPLGPEVEATATAGVDYYTYDSDNTFALGANTSGTIVTAPNGSNLTFSTTSNTGYFGQLQFGWRDAVFLTGGLRVDDNSSFGGDVGGLVQPRIGLAAARDIGRITLKVRGSYGRAIRAPFPGASQGAVTPTQINLANNSLQPERQLGWDAGVDLIFGDQASIGITGYDQTAEDLIAFVQVGTDPLPTFQFQNLGKVDNSGVEVEGILTLNRLQLRAQYGYVRSRIRELGSATGTGLEVGASPVYLPAHTAGGSATYAVRTGTSVTLGAVYVGSYRATDLIALGRCLGETGPCPPDFVFLATYPDFLKLNASVSQRLLTNLEGFLAVDNLTNNEHYEPDNARPVLGRMTSLGLRASY